MNTNLVSSPGVKNRFNQCRPTQTFENMIRSPRGSAHVFVHGHAFAMRRMPRNRSPNLATLTLNLATNNRMISLIYASACELVRERQVRIIVLGDNQTTARVFVETMNN